ncbi:MAG: substrate-binding domain-containing protein [Chthonomonadales bacterium]|nr:substrate-binding domain-containing protein [Chthonomonadales bacterium]
MPARSNRRAVQVLLAALLALAAGCRPSGPAAPARDGAAKGRPLVGVSLLTMANPFFKDMADAMRAEADRQGFDLSVTAGENDAARQRDQVNDFIVKRASAIVLCPCDSRAVGTAISAANQAGVPVFTADIASLDPLAKVVCHVATDNHDGGKLAGKAMIQALGGKGTVAIVDHPEVESVLLRTRGFREALAGAPGIRVVAQLPGGGVRDVAFKTAQDILEKHPDLAGIFAINDPTALGAVAAIEKAGRTGKVKVIGFDGMPEAKQAIKEGRIWADAVQYPDRIGITVIQSVAKYMAGEKVPSRVLIPTGLYMQEDARQDPALR